jgi:hypothetical protein
MELSKIGENLYNQNEYPQCEIESFNTQKKSEKVPPLYYSLSRAELLAKINGNFTRPISDLDNTKRREEEELRKRREEEELRKRREEEELRKRRE